MHKIAVGAALPVLCVIALAGCGSESAPASEVSPSIGAAATVLSGGTDQVAELKALVKKASAAPAYSATMTTRTFVAEQQALVMSGPVNFNGGPLSGHVDITTAASGDTPATEMEIVMTGKKQYVRTVGTGSKKEPWTEVPDEGSASVADLSGYALFLLSQGPEAVKGEEIMGTGTATRLSGLITTEDVRTLEPNLYDRLSSAGVESFDCDMWIDESGRTVRLEQWVTIGDYAMHNILELSKFGAAFKQEAPED